MNAEDTSYRYRAEKHRPTDSRDVAAEVRRLHSQGLKVHDIAAILRLGVGAVLQALREEA
jgi:hypothetical protein